MRTGKTVGKPHISQWASDDEHLASEWLGFPEGFSKPARNLSPSRQGLQGTMVTRARRSQLSITPTTFPENGTRTTTRVFSSKRCWPAGELRPQVPVLYLCSAPMYCTCTCIVLLLYSSVDTAGVDVHVRPPGPSRLPVSSRKKYIGVT